VDLATFPLRIRGIFHILLMVMLIRSAMSKGSHEQRVDFRRTAGNSNFPARCSTAIRSCVHSSHKGFLSSLRIIIESLALTVFLA
jgi:hypothetical protein